MTEEHGSIRGTRRPDGSFVGYDYNRQEWIDTSFAALRDPSKPLGSASNPHADDPRG